MALAWLQGDPAWTEQAQAKDGQGLSLTFTLWNQDCVVTVDELSKLPLHKMAKLYTVSTNIGNKWPCVLQFASVMVELEAWFKIAIGDCLSIRKALVMTFAWICASQRNFCLISIT